MPNPRKRVEEVSNAAEAERYRYIQLLNRTIASNFDSYIDAIVNYAYAQANNPNKLFSFVNYPSVRNYVDRAVAELVADTNTKIVNGIGYGWDAANAKNDLIMDIRLKDSALKDVVFYDPNLRAKQRFLTRVEEGLNLSQRVFKAIQPLQGQIEDGLALSISKGESAAQAGRKLRQYLREPNAQVRDKVRNRQVGQGVYRSATRNVERLTRTEINNAYRSADQVRWKVTPFILGFEVRLSAQHPKYDICDPMAGQYPKDFLFSGWHPQCLCYTVPVLMNDQQFGAYQKLVLSGEDTEENVARVASRVLQIPESAKKWASDNMERLKRLKNTPYWLKDNAGVFKEL